MGWPGSEFIGGVIFCRWEDGKVRSRMGRDLQAGEGEVSNGRSGSGFTSGETGKGVRGSPLFLSFFFFFYFLNYFNFWCLVMANMFHSWFFGN